MARNMKLSGHIYKYPDNYAKIYQKTVASEKKASYAAKNNKRNLTSRLFNRTIQKMRKTKLQMSQGERSRAPLLSCYQRIQKEPHYDLRTSRIQETSRREFGQLSEDTANHRGNMRYQSQSFDQESIFLRNKLRFLEWCRPP